MKTISIKQLHAETGRWVRAAKKTPLIVTDRGEEVAVLKPIEPEARPKAVFDAARRLEWMPSLPVDSTLCISEDRDER